MLHPQLIDDCHVLFRLPECQVLLHRNAIVPWFILVPETETIDLLDLPAPQRDAIIAEAALVAKFLQQHWNLQKINFAQIGNVVPQMHLHIIGRAPGDHCWPKPVWGNLTETKEYSAEEVRNIIERLRAVHSTIAFLT